MEFIDAVAVAGVREPLSCVTHLAAVPFFGGLGYLMVRKSRLRWPYRLSLAVLAVCTVFLLSMSGVYHMLSPGTGRYVMRQLDIAGVFTLIAGTATPIHMILFRGTNRWLPLGLIWSAAIAGIVLRMTMPEGLPPGVGNTIFLILGWGGAVGAVLLWQRYGAKFVSPLIWGGVAYTIGVIVLTFRWPVPIPGVVGAHELWHLAVLVGLALHWLFVYRISNGAPVGPLAAAT